MDYLTTDINSLNHNSSVLKEYYAKYLKDIRGLSDSSVKHYYDALNHISRRLKEKGLIKQDLYEVNDVENLEELKEILYSDPDFIALNERGKRMYSAGLNNYCKFARGEGFKEAKQKIELFDTPIPYKESNIIERKVWERSNIIRIQAIELAEYECEIDKTHKSFTSEKTKKPYMEGHHAIPLNSQETFSYSLDVFANIVCLCPMCHSRIHYGVKKDRVNMAREIYDKRGERLAKSGICLSKREFVEISTKR